jgi:hypothetical protein
MIKGAPSLGTRPTEAGFNHSLDSVACVIVTPWQHKRMILHTSRNVAVVCLLFLPSSDSQSPEYRSSPQQHSRVETTPYLH